MLARRLVRPVDIENLEESLEGTIENALSSDFMNCVFDCWSMLAVASGVGLYSFSRWKRSRECEMIDSQLNSLKKKAHGLGLIPYAVLMALEYVLVPNQP